MFVSFSVPASTVKSKQRPEIMQILVISVLLFGLWDVGSGANREGFQQIQQDSITGVLSNVPLRDVLTQLQESLGFEYVVPEEELDTPISIELSGDSFLEALPKILSAWDYAVQTDQHGNVQHIYVVKKLPSGFPADQREPVEFENDISPMAGMSQQQSAKSAMPQVRYTPELESGDLDQEEPPSPQNSPTSDELAQMVQPPLPTDSMPLVPASDLPLMEITPASELPEMSIIPSSGYPPMEIFPVSEEDRKAFEESFGPVMDGGEKLPVP